MCIYNMDGIFIFYIYMYVFFFLYTFVSFSFSLCLFLSNAHRQIAMQWQEWFQLLSYIFHSFSELQARFLDLADSVFFFMSTR